MLTLILSAAIALAQVQQHRSSHDVGGATITMEWETGRGARTPRLAVEQGRQSASCYAPRARRARLREWGRLAGYLDRVAREAPAATGDVRWRPAIAPINEAGAGWCNLSATLTDGVVVLLWTNTIRCYYSGGCSHETIGIVVTPESLRETAAWLREATEQARRRR